MIISSGLMSHEDMVNVRREKLREILLKEEMGLIHEVIDQAQHGDDARMDDMRRTIEEIHKEEEEQRLALLAQKRMQQYVMGSALLREELSKKAIIEAKQINLAQMAENEVKRQAEKELDDFWHQMMLKEVQAKMQRDVEETKRRCLLQENDTHVLMKQMAGKSAMEEQKKRIWQEDVEHTARLREVIRKEELDKMERDRQKKEELKKELLEQIRLAKTRLAEEDRHEKEMDRLRALITAEELAREEAAIVETTAAFRSELLAHLEYLETLKKQEEKRNIEIDRLVQQSLNEAAARRDKAVKKFKEVRQKLMQDVLEGREKQLRMKREMEKKEEEDRLLEKEMLEKEIEMEAKLTANAKKEERERVLCYKKELEEQWKLKDETRRKEIEEGKKMYLEELKRQDDEYNKMMDVSQIAVSHPFKILLNECATRYAAEKEGKCTCPPPLDE